MHSLSILRVTILAFSFLATTALTVQADDYPYGPDSSPQDVPHGKVSERRDFISTKAYPGVHHDYWVYVPAQYDGKTPTAVMVFNDGGGFVDSNGPFRVPVVFDNLIARKQMPVTIAVMISPGSLPAADPATQLPRYMRSYEYDACSDRYARFLIEEVLPKVGEEYKLTDDPNLRAICGSSSGGSCSFTAAWERPDAFRRVVSFIGTFTDVRGANDYPDLIRKTEPKPLRVFQQDGKHDLSIWAGDWYVANQDMASALEFAGYTHRFDVGTTSHDTVQSGPLMPEAMRWVWQDWEKPITARANPKQPVMEIIDVDQPWQVVSAGHKFTEGTAADARGNVYFSDIPNDEIWKVDADGKAALFADHTKGANGLKIGPDGRLYACQSNTNSIVVYDVATAKPTTITDGIREPNDLVVTPKGDMYVTEPMLSQVWHVLPSGEKSLVIEKKNGIAFPNGIGLTPDRSQLIVVDTRGTNFWIFTINPDGALGHGAPYYTARLASTDRESGADGLCVDTEGRLYVATRMGIEVFEEGGRLVAIIPKPQDAKVRNQWLANLALGGKDLDQLYIACGDTIYRRKTTAKGCISFQPASKPAPPK